MNKNTEKKTGKRHQEYRKKYRLENGADID